MATATPIPIVDASPGEASESYDQIGFLERNLERQIAAIRASDVKITFLVPTTTAMLGFLAANVSRAGFGVPTTAYALASAAPLILAYASLALTVIPRLGTGKGRSKLFFGSIACHSVESYVSEVCTLRREEYVTELAEQCHATALIARKKYRHVRNAYLCFFVALPFWTTAIYLLNKA